ncbi:MAG: helix-turn-helix transcriptional regulator [Lachnospiraceae bacterium]|nr:helix-turn-helix transcriptional regulator [Lachnospiraceae bacterium]
MYLNDLLNEKKMSKYRLSKESGVPQTTIIDICSRKARIEKCSADTIYRIAKALDVSMESLIEEEMQDYTPQPRRGSFEVYKSSVCHLVKDKGDIDFVIDTLSSDEVRRLYNRRWYAEAFYLLAMVDYISRENNIPICGNYNDIRMQRLPDIVYPASVMLLDAAMQTDIHRKECMNNAIPEFLKFNIVENEVRNVC